MRYCDLLDRMKENDTGAFLELTDRYGWAVYSAICEKYPDPIVADKVYNETMNAFYYALAVSDAEDPLEALLTGFANRISPDRLLFDQSTRAGEHQVPEIRLCHGVLHSKNPADSARKPIGFWYVLAIVLILLTIAGLLWIIAGMLMEMGYLPFYDLGYSWLFSHLMQLL